MQLHCLCFAAHMRFVFRNVYAELTNVRRSVCVRSRYSFRPVHRKLFCLHYGLKRLVELAYSQHIIKYMSPLIGRLCILIAAAANTSTFSSVRKKNQTTTTTTTSSMARAYFVTTPFWSSFHFRKHNANVLTHKQASTFSA